MKKLVKLFPWLVTLAALAMLSGCASVCGVDAPATSVPPTHPVVQTPQSTPPPPPLLPTTYTVEKCDDLWSISAKANIYNDPMYWPCILNANKDQIRDPNRIKEGQILTIPRNLTSSEMAGCRAEAARFPKYVIPAGAKRYCPPK
ncbi:MAG: LysM peptidoglycan-binding domain-containing protein [Desulfarculales bacterium]|jgi:Tfp pilus assembly protein FimV|nr:LysM peptidoglycan-binding domain-containing protein [Desulfarculales bacterium]